MLVIVLLACSSASANQVRVHSAPELVERSDLIAVVKAVGCRGDNAAIQAPEVCVVEVTSILKGDAEPSVELMTVGQFVELDVDCCEKSVSYLVFAVRGQGSKYVSTNGPYGVYKIEDGWISGWRWQGSLVRVETVLEELNAILGRTSHVDTSTSAAEPAPVRESATPQADEGNVQ
jgi:hypothetical protein